MNNLQTYSQFDVPILMILFNRPTHALEVFNVLRNIRPTKLFIAVDGPRHNHIHEVEEVIKCRQLAGQVDWPCQVQNLFREENLGCKKAVSSAIDWFFENVEYGIILEDDCLPDMSFFSFCKDLLVRYEKDESIMHIAGTNLLPRNIWGDESYFFSKICFIWGWATWRRAWLHYDLDMKDFPADLTSKFLNRVVTEPKSVKYWEQVFEETYNSKIDTWDYQWMYSIWKCAGLCIIPSNNLIKNIGFGDKATHTILNTPFANMETLPIYNIIHPKKVEENFGVTNFFSNQLHVLPSRIEKFKIKNEMRFYRIKKMLKKLLTSLKLISF